MSSSAVNTALSVGNIIGIVVGVLSGIATIICLIITICYFCKNKNRNDVWAEPQQPPPPYYYDNRAYGQPTNTAYYQRQATADTYNQKF